MTWRGLVCAVLALSACRGQLGTDKHPLALHVVPAGDASEQAGEALERALDEHTDLAWEVTVPDRYIDVVVALGDTRADVAFTNTMAYLLAREEYGAQAVLSVVRGDGEADYRGVIVVRADAGIESVADLDGKRIAYVDVLSVSGYVLPAMVLRDQDVHPREIIGAGSHAEVVRQVLSGEVDAGFAYEGARSELVGLHPQVMDEVVILARTDAVPNEPVVLRPAFPAALQPQVVAALRSLVATDDGRAALGDIADITGLEPVTDADYDTVRAAIGGLGKSLDELVPGGGILELERTASEEPLPPLSGG